MSFDFIPGQWDRVNLAQAGTWLSGGTPSRANEAYWGGDVPWLGTKDLGPLRLHGAQEHLTSLGAASGTRLLQPGSIVFAVRGMSLAKEFRVGVTQCEMAFNQDLKAIVPNPTIAPMYLGHYLKYIGPRVLQRVETASHGTKRLPLDRVESLPVPLPPLPAQRRIADILDKADAIRRKRKEAIALTDELLRSAFLDMFGDPVTNPKGWPVRSLAEFYISKTEGTRCGPFGSALKKGELADSGVPVWNMDNISKTGRTVLPFRMWITRAKYQQLQAYSVIDGDVLISRAGTVGKMCVANTGLPASIISTNLIRVRFGPDLLPIFFVSLMTYCKGRVGRLRTGKDGAFTHMNTGVLDKLNFPWPPVGLQAEFRDLVEAVAGHAATHERCLTEAAHLFNSLVQRAFRGEL